MDKIEYLRLARELFGYTDFEQLIRNANSLKDYLEAGNDIKDITTNQAPLLNCSSSEFARRCTLMHPMKGKIPFNLYEYQEKVLDFIDRNRHVVVINTARQMGISSLIASYALRHAIQNNNSTVLFMASKFAIGLEIIDRMVHMMEGFKDEVHGIRSLTKSSITFDNGSKIIVRSASRDVGRGLSCDIVIMADAAYYSYSVDQDLWNSIVPQISMGGQIIVFSTPHEPQGMFHRLWTSSPSLNLSRLKITWEDHPHRDQNWADKERKQMGELGFLRQFEGEFVSSNPSHDMGL